MIRSNLPELIVAFLLTLALFIAYAVTGSLSGPPVQPERVGSAAIHPRFLLELRSPKAPPWRIENDGRLPGGGRLAESDLTDLRGYVARLVPRPDLKGPWTLRFYDRVDRREVRFDPAHPPAEVAALLRQLKLLGVYP